MNIFTKIGSLVYSMLIIIIITTCTMPNIKNDLLLNGKWQVKLDSLRVGENEKWANKKFKGLKIMLPGTLDDAKIGKPSMLKPAINNYVLSNLVRKHQYIGKAWYQREVVIPDNWMKKDVYLTLERVIWESKVYLNGDYIGTANSLIGNHKYNLSGHFKKGKNILTISIDNSDKFPYINTTSSKYPDLINQEMAHAYTNHTQIKWNGILGNINLTAYNHSSPHNLQIYPKIPSNRLKISFEQKIPQSKSVHLEITNVKGESILSKKVDNLTISNSQTEFEIDKPKQLMYWDEFNPMLYIVKIKIGDDTLKARFGYKEIEQKEGKLLLNNHPIFLRGNLECSIFPLTGHPPMEKSEWVYLIRQAKSYGLNHLRFHSWCPPRAAFEAADEAGFYYQVELPHWSLKVGHNEETTNFLIKEARKIVRDYGNHPSFILMSLGNELEGDVTLMNTMVSQLKKLDSRHLYTTTSFSFQKPMGSRPEPQDEYFVTQWTDKGWVRGQGIFNDFPPHFDKDYASRVNHINVPVITHEIGQYAVYPDMGEIPKYNGVLKPLNFIAIQNELKSKHLIDLAEDFTFASGKLASILYKEEIERVLKTSDLDGFQLLQLQDFPGQGTALVGLLNAFWESKGIISPEDFREFNSEVVPLLRFDKAVYENGEKFKASLEVANYFKPMKSQIIEWLIIDDDNIIIKKGKVENINLAIGSNSNLCSIDVLLDTKKASKLTIKVSIRGTEYKNHWSIWVYPKSLPKAKKDIVITSSFNEAIKHLNKGEKVFLNPSLSSMRGIQGRFVPVFWSPVHFPNQPGTMGLLIDEKHSAFKDFPTDSYTNWQWWDLCKKSKSIVLDSLMVTPLVRIIDNFVTNHHLANVFETRVGDGKLLLSSIDLKTDIDQRPVARQLRYSLLKYMNSDYFNPSSSISNSELKSIFSD